MNDENETQETDVPALLKQIKAYTAGLTAEVIAGILAEDHSGDCFDCIHELELAMHVPPEKRSVRITQGSIVNGEIVESEQPVLREHLLMHLEQKYYHGTLLLLAFTETGFREPLLALRMHADPLLALRAYANTTLVCRTVKKFFINRLVKTR